MKVTREDMLKELGLWPEWRLRGGNAGAPPAGSEGMSSAGRAGSWSRRPLNAGATEEARVATAGSGALHPAPGSHPRPSAAEPARPSAAASSAAGRERLVQGAHDRGYPPHVKARGATYFVTLRLGDSLPQGVLEQWQALSDAERAREIERYLDSGAGECWLRDARAASAVRDAFLKFDGERYRLHEWVIMPNHVHLLIEPLGEHSLPDILQGIKSVSAHEANRVLGREGAFWQRESYDHLVRNDSELNRFREYVRQNPVKAGLAARPEEFAFGSAARAGGAPALQEATTKAAGGAPALQETKARTAGEAPALQGETDERRAAIAAMSWAELKAAVAGCTACPLHKGRTQTVFGVGDERAGWLFVGEGPGAEEDARGEPFVGQAGKLLDNMLAAINLERGENVYIGNIVKCRPPGNRNPEPSEAHACEPFLHRQIELIRPKLIVALGKVAVLSLLATDASIASLRGKVHQWRGIPLIVTYHPAYLLRNMPDKAKAWRDLVFAAETFKGL